MSELRNNQSKQQYELLEGEQVIGLAKYQAEGKTVELYHTEVEDDHEGEGLGSQLAQYALDDIKAQGKRVIPTCAFIVSYINHHPKYQEMVQT